MFARMAREGRRDLEVREGLALAAAAGTTWLAATTRSSGSASSTAKSTKSAAAKSTSTASSTSAANTTRAAGSAKSTNATYTTGTAKSATTGAALSTLAWIRNFILRDLAVAVGVQILDQGDDCFEFFGRDDAIPVQIEDGKQRIGLGIASPRAAGTSSHAPRTTAAAGCSAAWGSLFARGTFARGCAERHRHQKSQADCQYPRHIRKGSRHLMFLVGFRQARLGPLALRAASYLST